MNRRAAKVFIILAALLTGAASLASRKTGVALAASEQAREIPVGAKVSIRSSYGQIAVSGWDSGTIEATATRADNNSRISVSITEQTTRGRMILIAPGIDGSSKDAVNLIIKVPRHVEISSVDALGANVAITSINNAVAVNTESGHVMLDGVQGLAVIKTDVGDITANNVGPLNATTQRGQVSVSNVNGAVTLRAGRSNIVAENIRGNVIAKINEGSLLIQEVEGSVDVAMTSGGLDISSIGQDVRVASIGGSVEIACVKGNVEVNSVSGNIALSNIGGDVESTATSGELSLTGELRPESRYRLKSHSSSIVMAVWPGGSGFSATLSSYTGEIETNFELKIDSPLQPDSSIRRVIGHYGDRRARIQIDSFSGKVSLVKAAHPENNNCRR
jgi:hypothetical protein